MQKLYERDGAPKVLRALRFLTIRLRGREEAAAVREAAQRARERLAETYEAWLQAREERVAMSQHVAYLDERLDEAMRDLSRRLLVETGGDRSDPRYRKLFTEPLSEAMAPVSGERQQLFVQGVLRRIEEEEAYAALREAAGRTAERLQALQQALAERRELSVAEAQARATLQEALEEARRAYNQAYPRLQLVYPEDPALVESFFYQRPSAPESNPEEDSEEG